MNSVLNNFLKTFQIPLKTSMKKNNLDNLLNNKKKLQDY